MLILESRGEILRWYLSASNCRQTGEIISPPPGKAPSFTDLPPSAIEAVGKVGYVLADGGPVFTQPVQEISPVSPSSHLNHLDQSARIGQLISDGLRSLPTARHFFLSETAFFRSLPEKARYYALPDPWRETFPRRGCSGLTHAWACHKAGSPARMVSVHLDDQSSVAAVENGLAIETSTGFSALDGLPSLSGSGAIDPAIVIELLRQGWDPDQVRYLLERESGFRVFTPGASSMADIISRHELPRRILLQGLLKAIGASLAAMGGAELISVTSDGDAGWLSLIAGLRSKLAFLINRHESAIPFQVYAVRREEILFDVLMQEH